MSISEKNKQKFAGKEKFDSLLTGKKLVANSMIMFDINLKWKRWKIISMLNLYLKCDVLMLADVVEKIRNNRLMNYGLCSSKYLGD